MNGFRIIGMVLLIMASIRLPATAQAPKTGQSSRKTKQKTVVLFVCEHGAVKSVIAAAHFNRLARERHLAMRAVARGTYPEAEIPSNVVSGLRADGLAPGDRSA